MRAHMSPIAAMSDRYVCRRQQIYSDMGCVDALLQVHAMQSRSHNLWLALLIP